LGPFVEGVELDKNDANGIDRGKRSVAFGNAERSGEAVLERCGDLGAV
jgi:hypothetical protein